MLFKKYLWLAAIFGMTAAWRTDLSNAYALDLSNDIVTLDLQVNAKGTPYIASAAWCANGGPIFRDISSGQGADSWFDAGDRPPAAWHGIPDPQFVRAQAARAIGHGMIMTWNVALVPGTATLRTWMRLDAAGSSVPQSIARFPIALGVWDALGGISCARWWEALTFEQREDALMPDKEQTLHSRVHSSDRNPAGQNPYWVWLGKEGRLFFGLEWCGGWEVAMKRTAKDNAIDFRLWLPESETQLCIGPESIEGPVLNITATHETDDLGSRQQWLRQRAALGKLLYGGPAPWYPLAYNNWYTTRFDFDGAFLQRQLDSLDPYDFDLFVVDAGWYKAVGEWEPDPAKFAPGQFEQILKGVKDKGVKVGIWSCPQFVHGTPDALPPSADTPPFYRKFIDGYLLNYTGMDFTQFMLDHAAALRTRYLADWWKYDQDFFVEKTQNGRMKNVIALQNALLAVRKAHPDLYMENCQSGGRMINEFTVLMTQNQWIRDGGKTGVDHARSNFCEALGALEFLPPWTVNRWTNNPDQNRPDDDEFTRTYCRSAMAGTWGIVADLPKIAERQRDIIVKEARYYRRLNALKSACRYDILSAAEKHRFAGIVYYDETGNRAAIMVMRWNTKGTFDADIPLPGLCVDAQCSVEDVDLARSVQVSGKQLRQNGLTVPFSEKRTSALVFIDAME